MRHEIMLYALSTCIHCRRLKKLLNEHQVEYQFRDVDLAVGEDREALLAAARRLNPEMAFPLLVIDGKAIVGFREQLIKEALELQ